jgi:acid stress chaperone HdeB
MKTIAAALTSAILLGCAPASATEIDLSAWTCKQFQAASKGDVDIILAWLDGYYRAEDDPPVIDRDQLAANARKVAAFCSTHPDVKLITAAGTLFERE